MYRRIILINLLLILGISCSGPQTDETALAMEGAYAALITKYREILKNVPNDSSYREILENRKSDLRMLLQQYETEPESAALQLVRSQIRIELEEYDPALSILDSLIDGGSPLKKFARFQKVRVLQNTDRYAEAIVMFKAVEDNIDLNEQYLEVMLNFAFQAPDLSDREKYSRQLLSLNRWPDNDVSIKAPVYRNLALIEKQKGDLPEAIKVLNQGITDLKSGGHEKMLEATLNLIHLIGQPAPELNAQTWLNSRPFQLREMLGKVVLVDFWATWCAPCRAVIPALVEEYRTYQDAGLIILGYTRLYGRYSDEKQRLGKVEAREEIRLVGDFLKRFDMTYPVAIGHDMLGFDAYFIQGIPTVIFIDKNGLVADFQIGSGNEQWVKQRIQELLNQ